MKIAIIDIIGLPYDGTTVYRQGLGGSESAVTYMSGELAALGFDVTVFNNCNVDHAHAGVYSGVTYRPLTDLALDHKFDIVISSRTIIPFMPPERYHELQDNRAMPLQGYDLYNRIVSKAQMRVLWMHDTFCLGDNYIEELAVSNRITDIFTLSDFHLTYVANCHHGRRRNFEVLKPRLFITRNGARKFDTAVDINAKDKNLFVYNASVTKGMIPLVNEVWPRVKQQIPTARLKVIGGYYRFSEAHGPDQQEQDWRRMVADPRYADMGIEFTGVIPQSKIAEILSQSYMMIYPAAFPETFGISSLESLLYNTPVATCRFGALEEIVPELAGYHLDYAIEPNSLFTDIDRARQCQLFANMVVQAWNNTYLHQQKQYYCNVVKDYAGWDSVALQWKQWIYKKTGNYLARLEYRQVSKINRAVHKIWNRRYTNTVEFEHYKTNNEQPIRVVSTFYNAEQYISKFIDSIACQDYDNYEVYMVNDASTDNTKSAIADALSRLPKDIAQKFHLIDNQENRGAVYNQVAMLRALQDTDSIVMIIDGDDWLVNDNTIFSYYNNIYDGTTEFTYGSCWSVVDNIPLISQPYPDHIRRARAYRQHRFNWILPYTHLRTFKSYLVKGIPDTAFKDANGQWYRAGGDGSTFYNLIEAADPNKVKCLSEVVYNYNDASPLNDYKVNGHEQNRTAEEIVNRSTTDKKESTTMDYTPILEKEYQWACETPSDINQHLPLLKQLADECDTVVELGVRTGVSTRALLASKCKLYSYDLELDPSVTNLFSLAQQAGKVCSYSADNSLTMTVPEADMLFIDTYHTYTQLSKELELHHSQAKKYIACHDTFTYGLKTDQDPKKGILTAILEFVSAHPEWRIKYHTSENNGFTVLEKVTALPVAPATTTKKILVAIPTARNIEAETFKSIYDLEVPDGYKVDFQYFYGYNIDQVRNLIADWIVRGYDYLFSVDSDIAFPADTLKRLLSHNVDMVSGLYIQRKPGQHILEVYEHNANGGVSNIPYEKIKGRGLVEIASCGFGCVLVKAEVMRAIPYPHFKYHSAIDHRNTISEDVDFCRKALQQGFKIWADTDIQCRHIGSSEFLIDNTIPARAPEPKEDIRTRLRDLGNQRLLPYTHVSYLEQLKNAGEEPRVIYDIGSCVMHWTNEALRIWPTAHYVLFEAMDSVEFLYQERGIRDYHIGVLGSESGRTVEFWQNDYHPGGNSYYKENVTVNPSVPEYFNEKHRRVYTTKTLTEVVEARQFPLPDLVKMDVQGAELDIVKGAESIIKHAKHVILELQRIEYNTGAPLNQEVIAYMDQLGFDCRGIFSDNGPDGDYHFVRR